MASPLDALYELSADEIRNAAICLIAADSALCDGMDAEDAVRNARRLADAVDTDPMWANGRHQGDCTKTANSCARCQLEEAEEEARVRYED